MAHLVIDMGNTFSKVAIFNNRQLICLDNYSFLKPEHLHNYIIDHHVTHSILSSVKADVITELEEILRETTNYLRFSTNLVRTVNNQYKSLQTLGLDRLAGIVGAQAFYPKKNCLVIDAGTCITYDAIDDTGLYRGGSISPGIHMRLKALHTFTSKLPLVNFDLEFTARQGTDTLTSLLSGVINGSVYEIKGFIEDYKVFYSQLHVLLCGGEATFFDTRLKNSIFASSLNVEPYLVLRGLNEIIYQQTK